MNEKREDNLIFETYAMVNETLGDADQGGPSSIQLKGLDAIKSVADHMRSQGGDGAAIGHAAQQVRYSVNNEIQNGTVSPEEVSAFLKTLPRSEGSKDRMYPDHYIKWILSPIESAAGEHEQPTGFANKEPLNAQQ